MSQDAKIDDKDTGNREVQLAEYNAAQSSAQHHDQLVWTVTSIVWAGSLALMGIILKIPMTGFFRVVPVFLCVLGAILSLFVWSTQREFHELKNQKYDRCKEIEKDLHMKHHLSTKWKEGSQKERYTVIMVLFLVAWFLVAMSILCN